MHLCMHDVPNCMRLLSNPLYSQLTSLKTRRSSSRSGKWQQDYLQGRDMTWIAARQRPDFVSLFSHHCRRRCAADKVLRASITLGYISCSPSNGICLLNGSKGSLLLLLILLEVLDLLEYCHTLHKDSTSAAQTLSAKRNSAKPDILWKTLFLYSTRKRGTCTRCKPFASCWCQWNNRLHAARCTLICKRLCTRLCRANTSATCLTNALQSNQVTMWVLLIHTCCSPWQSQNIEAISRAAEAQLQTWLPTVCKLEQGRAESSIDPWQCENRAGDPSLSRAAAQRR